MVCYRRHGHNEGDDPSYTQPLMYQAIAERRSVRKLYVESAREARRHHGRRGRAGTGPTSRASCRSHWTRPGRRRRRSGSQRSPKSARSRSVCSHTSRPVSTRPTRSTQIFRAPHQRIPDGFTIAPEARSASSRPAGGACSRLGPRRRLGDRRGARDRLTRARGETRYVLPARTRGAARSASGMPRSDRLRAPGEPWVPLNELPDGAEARFWVYDTMLSEYAAHWATSTATAQANRRGARRCGRPSSAISSTVPRSMIDQYIVAAEDKWGQQQQSGRDVAPARVRRSGARAQRRRVSSDSSRLPPRTTCRSCNARRRQPSTSICSGGRRTQRSPEPHSSCSPRSRACG